MSRPAPPTTKSPTGGGKGAAKFKRRATPEQRERLSQVARERHAKSEGKGFGRGQHKPGTQRRSKKASEARVASLVAEAAREAANAQAIIDVFKDGVHSSQQMHIRLKAAQAWIEVEQKDAALKLREEDAQQIQRGREELLELLSGKFTQGPAAAILRRQLTERVGESNEAADDDVIDVEGEEITEE